LNPSAVSIWLIKKSLCQPEASIYLALHLHS